MRGQTVSLRQINGLRLDLATVGVTLLSCQVPLPNGGRREVLVGAPPGHLNQSAYMGCVIGRYANRIAHAKLARNGRSFDLLPSPGSVHQLHGGPGGFHVKAWRLTEQSPQSARFDWTSGDGDQGFPGELQASITVGVTQNEVRMDYEASCSRECPVCITHHPYFNLNAGHANAMSQRLMIAASRFAPLGPGLIPDGTLRSVDGSAFDFRQPKRISQDWARSADQAEGGGYDHGFLLDSPNDLAATLQSDDGVLTLEVRTSLPALQIYTGKFLEGVVGRDGRPLSAHAGIAIEPEFLPDSPNRPDWPQPDVWLKPGQIYRHRTTFRFIAKQP